MEHHKYDLLKLFQQESNPDCIKRSPFNDCLFAVSHYKQIIEYGVQRFDGAIQLFLISNKYKECSRVHHLNTLPIMHFQWVPQRLGEFQNIVAIGRSEQLLIISCDESKLQLFLTKKIKLPVNSFTLYCHIDLSKDFLFVLISTSDSQLLCLKLSVPSYQLLQHTIKRQHNYALWACKFQPLPSKLMSCGDEEGVLYFYCIDSMQEKNNAILKNKTEGGGICDIAFKSENELLVGYFGGSLRLYDLRMLGQPIQNRHVGGTVWRCVPTLHQGHIDFQQVLVANSSEHKFQILGPKGEEWNSGKQHQSLAYAADCNEHNLMTGSFYDGVVAVWGKCG